MDYCDMITMKGNHINFSIIGLFAWGFLSQSTIFHSKGDVTMTGEGLQFLTFGRHLLPLCSEVLYVASPIVTRDIRL